MTHRRVAALVLCGLACACAPQPMPQAAPPSPPPAPATAAAPPQAEPPVREHRIIRIRSVNCAALLQLAEDDRASASMFYLGYTASRRGRQTIDIADIDGLESAALGYCIAHPRAPAAVAYMQAFRNNGR